MTLKKRVAIFKKGGVTTRFDYKFQSDEEFEASLKKWADKMGYAHDQIITYDIGDADQVEDGAMFFCPRCGSYNEYAYDPDLRMYYREDKKTGELKEAGYHKHVPIDCDNCGEVFRVESDKFNKQMEKLNKEYFAEEKE